MVLNLISMLALIQEHKNDFPLPLPLSPPSCMSIPFFPLSLSLFLSLAKVTITVRKHLSVWNDEAYANKTIMLKNDETRMREHEHFSSYIIANCMLLFQPA
jgi:hypothetical protein